MTTAQHDDHDSWPPCDPDEALSPRFAVGQTVRWSAALTRDWYEGRAADDADYAQGAQVGRITAVWQDDGYCGTCDSAGLDCAGPWYGVDFGQGDATGFGGCYAEHELEPA